MNITFLLAVPTTDSVVNSLKSYKITAISLKFLKIKAHDRANVPRFCGHHKDPTLFVYMLDVGTMHHTGLTPDPDSRGEGCVTIWY